MFGSTSQSQIDAIQQSIDVLESNQIDIDNRLKQFENQTLSIMALQHARMDNMDDMVDALEVRFTRITNTLNNKILTNSRLIAFGVGAITNLMYEIEHIRSETLRFIKAIRGLVQGRLTVDLIDEHDFSRLLRQLARTLRKKFPS
jgi:hypothetical protein